MNTSDTPFCDENLDRGFSPMALCLSDRDARELERRYNLAAQKNRDHVRVDDELRALIEKLEDRIRILTHGLELLSDEGYRFSESSDLTELLGRQKLAVQTLRDAQR